MLVKPQPLFFFEYSRSFHGSLFLADWGISEGTTWVLPLPILSLVPRPFIDSLIKYLGTPRLSDLEIQEPQNRLALVLMELASPPRAGGEGVSDR